MRAAVAVSQNPDSPLDGLRLMEWPTPEAATGWTRVKVASAALNPHDTWTLQGVGHPPERIPIVLGCDAAGVTDDGRHVVIHPVIGDAAQGRGDQTLDPGRSLLSETIDGGLAEYIVVPDAMVVPKPENLSFSEAACLGVAWGTAYRMLFTRARLQPGDVVLVQGGSGGVASAAIALAAAAGALVYATARTEAKRRFALDCGAHQVFESGARLPQRADVVVETVGEATWAHSLRSTRPGGTIVIAGATSGGMPPSELHRLFYQQLSVVGSTGCTRTEFESLLRFLEATGVRPHYEEITFEEVPNGFRRLLAGEVMGKLVARLEG